VVIANPFAVSGMEVIANAALSVTPAILRLRVNRIIARLPCRRIRFVESLERFGAALQQTGNLFPDYAFAQHLMYRFGGRRATKLP
jgi:hypothetical protein